MDELSTFTERDWNQAAEDELRRGYEEMASDIEHEKEALQWTENLIGEAI